MKLEQAGFNFYIFLLKEAVNQVRRIFTIFMVVFLLFFIWQTVQFF